MTKEVDFLSLSKTSNNKVTTSNNPTSIKKEGLSLFDSLLANKIDNNVENKADSKTISNESSSKESEFSKTSLKNQVDNNNLETKNTNTEENSKKTENKNSETLETKDTKSGAKITQSSTSLLDKMIIDAKNTLNSTQVTNIKTENANIENKETVNIKTENANIENKETVNTKTENTNIENKEVETSKTETSKTENKEVEKTNNTVNTGIKNLESNLETPKTETSLLDKMIEQAKVEIANKENLDNFSSKENITKNINGEINSITKESLIEVKTETPKIENKTVLNELSKELKNQNTPKDNTLVNKVENKINASDLENETENKVENKAEIKIENKTENKPESKLEIRDNKETKVNLVKEQIQTTLNFEDESTEEVKVENKIESKNTNISKELVQKNTQNIEEKVEIKDSSKIENKITPNEKITPITTDKQINETVSKEFAKLDSSVIVKEEQKVNIDKNTLLKENTQELKTPRSLMDRLLDNASKTINITDNQDETTPSSQNTTGQNTSNTKANDFVTNIFLGSQKNSIYNQMIANKTEGVKVVKEGTNVEDIKKGAELLNLGLKDTSIETKVNTNQSTNQVNNPSSNNKENDLNRLAFNRNINNNENLENKQNTKILNNQKINPIDTVNSTANSTAIIANASSVIEEAVTLNVSPSLVLSIQNRIIGAQQHMSSMMSDIARNMYENYKPPVTAFRINLFPAQLGQIAILMKNDKENSISISLNMSNSNTLDAFVENQNTLRDALNKNFNNNQTTFNLDFNMGNESSSNKSFSEQENNKNNEAPSSNEIIEAINQNQDVGEDLNYL